MGKRSKRLKNKAAGDDRKRSQKRIAYLVEGMHCASCVVLIESRLLEIDGVKKAKADLSKGRLLIEYEGNPPTVSRLNSIFKDDGFIFSGQVAKAKKDRKDLKERLLPRTVELAGSFFIAFVILYLFSLLNRSSLSSAVNVNETSSIFVFLLFGFMASLSSCSALVGGIIVSMSKRWNDLSGKDEPVIRRLGPHFAFNLGRLVSYAAAGALLGAIGARLELTGGLGPALTISVSLMMIILAFQMLGFKSFNKFQIRTPAFLTCSASDGRRAPFLMGALTFLLPCGFTITAQSLSLISKSPLKGGLMMLTFALGTLPALLGIGLASVKLGGRPGLSRRFMQVAAVIVLFFAFFNIDSQLNVLGYSNFSDVASGINEAILIARGEIPASAELAPIEDGVQVIRMDAYSYEYSPAYFKVREDIPVRWEITDQGTSGCTNAVIARGLFEGEIPLTQGEVSVKEFTPNKAGRYKFSCWMGMVSGMIDVIGEDYKGSPKGLLSEDDFLPLFGTGSQGAGCCSAAPITV